MNLPDFRGLVLIPTPIEESLPLEPLALELLQKVASDSSSLILVEELKVARTRWLRWGLPREAIERFIPFNEHTEGKKGALPIPELVGRIQSGARAVLMSDGGLPAFCDPGMKLVDACHDAGVRVTASPFPHSISLALALSGIDHRSFYFAGFLPAATDERKRELERIFQGQRQTIVLMDTPYRLKALLQALADSPFKNRKTFLALELNSPRETLLRGKPAAILASLGGIEKAEFVIVISA
jgi:16S rRNA (cytidine1402-2'-O)-methyltransferase